MPSINMIAARRAEKLRLEKRLRAVLLVVVVELVVAVGLLSFMAARVYSANKTIERLDRDLVAIQPTVDRIGECELRIRELMPKLNLLVGSRDETLLWCGILRNLSLSIPEQTWLGTLSTARTMPVNPPAGAGTSGSTPAAPALLLSLRGVSTSQRLVGETMLRMNQFPEFERVDLDYTQKGTSQDIDTLDFQLSIRVKPIGEKKGVLSANASR